MKIPTIRKGTPTELWKSKKCTPTNSKTNCKNVWADETSEEDPHPLTGDLKISSILQNLHNVTTYT